MKSGEKKEEQKCNGIELHEAIVENKFAEQLQRKGVASPDRCSIPPGCLQSRGPLIKNVAEKSESLSPPRGRRLERCTNEEKLNPPPSDRAKESDEDGETRKASERPEVESNGDWPSEKAVGKTSTGSSREIRHSFELIYGIIMSRNVVVLPELWKQNSKVVQHWYKISSPCHNAILMAASSPGKAIGSSAATPVAVKELNRCENAWKPRWKKTEQECLEEDKLIELVKRTRTLMNKLTAKTLPLLTPEMGKILADCNSDESLTTVISIIHNKAVDELPLAPIYGEMCALLLGKIFRRSQKDEQFLLEVALRNQVRRGLLNLCQGAFDKGLVLGQSESGQSEAEVVDGTEMEERKERERARALGNASFVGHLFNVGILNIRLTLRCIAKVVNLQTDHGVDLTVKLIKAVGFKMWKESNSEEKKLINCLFDRMKQLSTDTKLTSRSRCMLLDLMDFKQNGYQEKKRR